MKPENIHVESLRPGWESLHLLHDCEQFFSKGTVLLEIAEPTLFSFLAVHAVCRILVPQSRIEPRPRQWKCWFLTTRPPGNSQNMHNSYIFLGSELFIIHNYSMLIYSSLNCHELNIPVEPALRWKTRTWASLQRPGTLSPEGGTLLAWFASFWMLYKWNGAVGMGFPGGVSGKEPACQCRRRKRFRIDP